MIIRFISWAANQHVNMISEGWNNGCWKYITIETIILYYTNSIILLQPEWALDTSFKNTTKSYQPQTLKRSVNKDFIDQTNQCPDACLSDSILNIAYIVLPTIPLLLLLIVATSVFCFKLFTKRCVVWLLYFCSEAF